VLDVVRGDRNKLVSLVRSSEVISKHPDSFEIANAVAQALKKEYAEKIPPRHPLSWSATTVDLTIENTGSETQRNVALSIDSAYCFLIVRGENR
jgi:molybdenum cofactor biosynthesis enzyme